MLLIDADSQGDATTSILGGVRVEEGDGLSAVLRGMSDYYPNVIMQTDVPGLDLLPASPDLGDIDLECIMGGGRPDLYSLSGMLEAVAEDDEYDVAVIDCPPYFSVSCLNAIAASDRIIIPTSTDAYSVVGMDSITRQLSNLRRTCPNVSVSGCLVTQWHRAGVVEDAVDYLREEAPVHVFKTVIRRTDKVPESTFARQAVGEWSPFCAASRDYRAFVAELMEREGMHSGR